MCADIRFPVPFAGYLSGPSAILPALIAILFYHVLMGGFIVQALLGGLGGLFAEYLASPNTKLVKRFCVVLSTIGASFGVLMLAILDKLIGPW